VSGDKPPGWWRSQTEIEAAVREAREARAYVTEDLVRVIDAFVAARGDTVEAAKALDMAPTLVSAQLLRATKIAARRGWLEGGDVSEHVPPGFMVKGISTLVGTDPETGERSTRLQWIKTKQDDAQRFDLMREACDGLLVEYRGKSRIVPPPQHVPDEDRMVILPYGDPHVGLYAWPVETGGVAFDLEIATRNIRIATQKVIDLAPPAHRCVLVLLGDNQHADSADNRTARSGHALDVDTRYGKVSKANAYCWREAIYMALAKFPAVDVVVGIGNHDDHSAMWLRLVLEAFFHDDPRVTILGEGGEKFHFIEFGRCLIGVTHGDTCKIPALQGVMACDMAEAWGRTRFRHWYTGHVHHTSVHELAGVVAESFRTLAARDAYTHFAGYRSDRDMRCDVWHRDRGLTTRHIVGIEEIEAVRSEAMTGGRR